MDQETPPFSVEEWTKLCAQLAAQATRGCGCIHDLYQSMFSEAVDVRLSSVPEEDRAAALEVAGRWDYLDPEGRAKAQQEMAEQGYCSHGLEPRCCPMGCGDLSWFDPNEEH